MRLKRKLWWLAPICLLLALACACGGFLAIRGDYRYRLGLRLRRYGELNLTPIEAGEEWKSCSVEALLSDPRVSVTDSLMLVNADHPITESNPLTLTGMEGAAEICLVADAAVDAITSLQARVYTQTGTQLLIASAYRSAELQRAEWEKYGDGRAARAGESEHQTGLALDVCVVGYGGASFLKTRAGRYVNGHCAEHGLIVRYPLGKEEITGFPYEPWHLRYVGAPHAKLITDAGLTLEEYLSMLTPDTLYQSGSYRILRSSGNTVSAPQGFHSCTVSRDNMGYTVFTFLME